MSGQKSIELALQGGVAHGALTWGVLDLIQAEGLFEDSPRTVHRRPGEER